MQTQKKNRDRKSLLIIVLYLTALHSLFVGIGLLVQLPALMDWMGFGKIEQPFFPAQGGVFHLLMAVAYFFAARHPERHQIIIQFIIILKISATVFLMFYFILIDPILMVLLSGLSDGTMALLILLLWRSYQNTLHKEA